MAANVIQGLDIDDGVTQHTPEEPNTSERSEPDVTYKTKTTHIFYTLSESEERTPLVCLGVHTICQL